MAEIKNSFIKSKMNKDLDDRLIQNGEYRDANNISVGRSEENDIGALENVIGNNLVTGTDLGNADLKVIGSYSNDGTNQVFVFLTDNTSTDLDALALSTTSHYVYVYNKLTSTYTLLVEGYFLNFSTDSPIYGINLLEELLFWTDNRNQPRKINVATALTDNGWYKTESQISVAKYNPYKPISLIKKLQVQVSGAGTTTTFTLAGDVVSSISPFIGGSVTCQLAGNLITGADYVFIQTVVLNGTNTDVTVNAAAPNAFINAQDLLLLISTMSNKDNDNTWPGDPNYLEDKFIRLSYRFKFEDGEYSLMAPFTQIAYIPSQKGYFLQGDQDAAYRSTVVDFMKNNVQNIVCQIPLPDSASRIENTYKISEIDILFKESDGLVAKVLESVPISTISTQLGVNNIYSYEYQSRKPYKTLVEAQTTRVYDKVPVRAFGQESAGNRIIYGNYFDKHTPPNFINYNAAIADKSSTGVFDNWIEYPNHSIKQNRNYQVGFILADKFGRSSPVILSSVDDGTTIGGAFFQGSTLYNPYNTTTQDIPSWFGDIMQVVINTPIISSKISDLGTPGLYAEPRTGTTTGIGFTIKTGSVSIDGNATTGRYSFEVGTTYPNNGNFPQVGDYLRGEYRDFVKVSSIVIVGSAYTVKFDGAYEGGRPSSIYLPNEDLPVGIADLKFAYSTINPTGWYSYKVVVKQQEQEYYNAYVPGILNGYPGQSTLGRVDGFFPTNGEIDVTAHMVLFNDNINKIPRDLQEVGPTQQQFRSSVQLYGRVTNNTGGNADGTTLPTNVQYFPNITGNKNALSHTVSTIASANDLNFNFVNLSTDTGTDASGQGVDGNLCFYDIDTNPLIARISTTEKSIGVSARDTTAANVVNMKPFLAVYETEPVESLLDIYWETTSTGLVADLNADILTGFEGPDSFGPQNEQFREFQQFNGGGSSTGDKNSPYITDFAYVINSEGANLLNTAITSMTVTNAIGENVSTQFGYEEGTAADADKFRFKILQNFTYTSTSAANDTFTFNVGVEWTDTTPTPNIVYENTLSFAIPLQNIIPGAPGDLTGSTPLQVAPYSVAASTTEVVPVSKYGTLNNGGADTDPSSVSAATVTTGGASYTVADNVSTTSPNGTGATVNILTIDGSGAILTVSINQAGSGYSLNDVLTVTQGAQVGSTLTVSSLTQNREELVFTIQSGNPQGALGNDLWVINSSTGLVTQVANSVATGLQTLVVRIADANATGTGSTFENIPAIPADHYYIDVTFRITIGYPPLNGGAKSTSCITNLGTNTLNNAITANMVTPRFGVNSGYGNEETVGVSGCWFISAYDLTTQSANNVGGSIQGDLPAEFVNGANGIPRATTSLVSTGTGANQGTTAPYRIGTENVQRGNVVVTLNVGMKNQTANPNARAVWDSFIVYAWSSTGQWVKLEDLNGSFTEYSQVGGIYGSQPSISYLENKGSSSNSTFNYFQLARAFSYTQLSAVNSVRPGQLAIVISGLRTTNLTTGDQASMPFAWVIADDLYNPSCIPWQGINAKTGWANTWYPINYSTANTTGWSCGDTPSNLSVVYAYTPYIEFADTFYTNTTLSTVFNGGSNWYNLQLDDTAFTTITNKQWQNSTGTDVDLRWSARIKTDGTRYINSGGNLAGDNHVVPSTLNGDMACPTTLSTLSVPSYYGAARIFQN
tara:strand:+ start:3201 stop:8198 length:4998 start_codon:yes stop_codon:yes gene_type:complete